MAEKTKKQHRDRKNPHAAEQFAAERKARNASRGKQVWVPEELIQIEDQTIDQTIIVPGHWERVAA